jgi:predicted flap endonuclease-1-like 5' DNA nuclease
MKLADIEGISPKDVSKLASVGIRTPHDLLEQGYTPAKRRKLATATGINQKLILEWVNMADLFRIKGIGLVYADLLEEAGVDTSKELSMRKAKQLIAAMEKVNSEKNLARRLPSLKQIRKAIAIATEIHRSSHSLAGDGTTDAPPPKKSRNNYGPRVEY